jgi:hypothetical protein
MVSETFLREQVSCNSSLHFFSLIFFASCLIYVVFQASSAFSCMFSLFLSSSQLFHHVLLLFISKLIQIRSCTFILLKVWIQLSLLHSWMDPYTLDGFVRCNMLRARRTSWSSLMVLWKFLMLMIDDGITYDIFSNVFSVILWIWRQIRSQLEVHNGLRNFLYCFHLSLCNSLVS